VLLLSDQHCATLVQMSLWRQVKVKLDQHKSVDGGFRYEEAIPPDTLMYFPWGITSQANGTAEQSKTDFQDLLSGNEVLQIGGQESLGRGFVQSWLN
jgi:CRISPR-associated protein Cmr4